MISSWAPYIINKGTRSRGAEASAASIRLTRPQIVVDARLLDHQRVAPQRPQHRDIVRGQDMEALAGQCQAGHQPDADPQRHPRREIHRRPAPHRRRRQDDPVDLGDRGAALAGHRDDGDSPAHALAEQVERHARITPAQDLASGRGVGGERRAPRPQPALGGGAKAALVVGVGSDAVRGPGLARRGKCAAVVVEAVQRQDHRLDRALRAAICAAAAAAPSAAMNSEPVNLGAGFGSGATAPYRCRQAGWSGPVAARSALNPRNSRISHPPPTSSCEPPSSAARRLGRPLLFAHERRQVASTDCASGVRRSIRSSGQAETAARC